MMFGGAFWAIYNGLTGLDALMHIGLYTTMAVGLVLAYFAIRRLAAFIGERNGV